MKLPYFMPIFRSVLFILGGVLFSVITNQTLIESAKWWTVLCTLFNLITIIVLFLVCKYEGIRYRDLIQYKVGQLNFKNVLIIIVTMSFIGVGGLYVFGLVIYGYVPATLIQPIPTWIAIINMVLFPTTIMFAELPLYFGYSFNRIKENTGNEFVSMSYIVFFYALQHSFIPLLFDWKYIIFRFLSFLPLMIVLSIIYNKKKALAPLMIGHVFLDLAAGMQILISSLFPVIFEIIQKSAGK